MKAKRILLIVLLTTILIIFTASGWVYNIWVKNAQLIESQEMATIQASFVQQYGSGATINQLVAPDKVYAAAWTDGDGLSHVSWNIGGVWAVIWTSPTP